jgi:hypothetical protein
MKKVSTAAVKVTKNCSQPKLTIAQSFTSSADYV